MSKVIATVSQVMFQEYHRQEQEGISKSLWAHVWAYFSEIGGKTNSMRIAEGFSGFSRS